LDFSFIPLNLKTKSYIYPCKRQLQQHIVAVKEKIEFVKKIICSEDNCRKATPHPVNETAQPLQMLPVKLPFLLLPIYYRILRYLALLGKILIKIP
jgi:hypothetical protein